MGEETSRRVADVAAAAVAVVGVVDRARVVATLTQEREGERRKSSENENPCLLTKQQKQTQT